MGDQVFADKPAGLVAFLASLASLSNKPSATLDRLVRECLDLHSHRLDAWITSLATQRLMGERKTTPGTILRGIHFGGYGWLEDVRPKSANPAPPGSEGFVHAPSLNHATTAAILRGGFLSHKAKEGDKCFAVNLSSARVRSALDLIDGVRQGQPLGALLGYRFERGLHENKLGLELDQYIAVFRELYPLAAGKQIPKLEDQPVEAIAANNVVDGLILLRKRSEIPFGKSFPNLNVTLPVSGDAYDAIQRELDALDEMQDAVADLLTAESVHQAVQGNPFRLGASLDALSRGEAPPSELSVVTTPARGIALTHRVLVLLPEPDHNDPDLAKWATPAPAGDASPGRALAEPVLNQWASKLLGDPARVKCTVEFLDPKGATGGGENAEPKVLGSIIIPLKKLGLCPLDALYAGMVTDTPHLSDLEVRVRNIAIDDRPEAVPASSPIRLSFARAQDWTAQDLSFPEFFELVRAVREMIAGARPLAATDLLSTGRREASEKLQLGDLEVRFGKIAARFVEVRLSLKGASTLDDLRKALSQIASLGVPSTVPSLESDLDALAAQGRAVLAELDRRSTQLEQAKDAIKLAQDADDRTLASLYIQGIQAVLGNEFVVIPRFALQDSPPGNSALSDLIKALEARTAAADAPPEVVIPWFQRAAKVRDGVRRLDDALSYSELVEGAGVLGFEIAQLPAPEVGTADRWLGLPLNKDQSAPGGRVSLALHSPGRLDSESLAAAKSIGGLFIDEWVEVIPDRKQVTGVAFHYDAPAACAPQAILLAVAPDLNDNGPWTVQTLASVLLDTLDMAKTRMVDPDLLEDVGHFLPALAFAFNIGDGGKGDTIATDFFPPPKND